MALMSILSLAALVWLVTPLRHYMSIAGVQALVDGREESWAFFFLVWMAFAIGNFLFIPIPLVTFASSLLFPVWKSIICCILGVSSLAVAGYALGSCFDLSRWPHRFQKVANDMKRVVGGKEFWAVLAIRITPSPPFTVISMIAGSCGLRLVPFVLGTVTAALPNIILINVAGSHMLQLLSEPSAVGIFTLIAVLVLAIAFRKFLKRYKVRENGSGV